MTLTFNFQSHARQQSSSQGSSFTNVYLTHSAENARRLKRAYILTATLSTWNKFAYEGVNVYSLPADGDCHRKRICHYALATETNRVMILMVLWKKMLLKGARNYDSVPWLSSHLSVFNFMNGDWNLISCWTCEHDSFVLILYGNWNILVNHIFEHVPCRFVVTQRIVLQDLLGVF